MISSDDFSWSVDLTLAQMAAILRRLGQDLSNARPELEGANSPYAIVTHCLGVMNYWGGQELAGREIVRDKDAEFRASGSIEDLIARIDVARELLKSDLARAEAVRARGAPADAASAGMPSGRTLGGVLLHLHKELAQHLGQLEISRDVLLAAR